MSGSAEPGFDVPGRSESGGSGRWRRAVKFAREHPYMTAIVLTSTATGAIFGALVPIGELALARRAIGGAIAGFYFGLFPLGYRLFE